MPSPDYRQVRVPGLAVFAGKDSIGCLWPAPSMCRTPTVVRYFSEVVQPLLELDRAQFAREAPAGRVVTIPCPQHEVPLTNPAELEKAMRDFFATTRAR